MDLGKARALLERHRPRGDGDDLRGWEWRYLAEQSLGDERFTIQASALPVSLAFLSTNLLGVGSRDGSVSIWDVSRRERLNQLHDEASFQGLVASPDGRYLAAAEENSKDVFIWRSAPLQFVMSVPAAVDWAGGLIAFVRGRDAAFILQGRDHVKSLVRVSLVDPPKPPEIFLETLDATCPKCQRSS